jgi:hypothetical protein
LTIDVFSGSIAMRLAFVYAAATTVCRVAKSTDDDSRAVSSPRPTRPIKSNPSTARCRYQR